MRSTFAADGLRPRTANSARRFGWRELALHDAPQTQDGQVAVAV